MCALAGAAAGLCAGAGLLHLSAFGQRSLVNCLESEALPLTLIKGLGKTTTVLCYVVIFIF